jgi:two-component system chemotaxis response regulator CheB
MTRTGEMDRVIRVLVAEDSPTTRAMFVELFKNADGFTIAGEAQNGAEAIERAIQLSPDLIVMDVHMPIIDGLDATKEIMRQAPTPILMVSASSNVVDVSLGLSATQAGALMLLEKPTLDRDELKSFLAMAKAMAAVKVVRRWSAPRGATPKAVPVVPRVQRLARLVAIGTSTGGPAALHRILIDLPRDFPAPILVVQHMARGFIDGLARWLSANLAVKVVVGADGDVLTPGTVYLGPDNRHMGASEGRIALSDDAPNNGFRPSIDYLFDSCARAYGPSMVAVMLTGMGQDGVEGLETVRARGGRVLAQDEESSVVYGMAQVAVERGLVNEVFPLDLIGRRLKDLVELAPE